MEIEGDEGVKEWGFLEVDFSPPDRDEYFTKKKAFISEGFVGVTGFEPVTPCL
jgi:hypothetical protein